MIVPLVEPEIPPVLFSSIDTTVSTAATSLRQRRNEELDRNRRRQRQRKPDHRMSSVRPSHTEKHQYASNRKQRAPNKARQRHLRPKVAQRLPVSIAHRHNTPKQNNNRQRQQINPMKHIVTANMCSPPCCCICSKRLSQSILPCTASPSCSP